MYKLAQFDFNDKIEIDIKHLDELISVLNKFTEMSFDVQQLIITVSIVGLTLGLSFYIGKGMIDLVKYLFTRGKK